MSLNNGSLDESSYMPTNRVASCGWTANGKGSLGKFAASSEKEGVGAVDGGER